MSTPWTEREDAILRRAYPRTGTAGTLRNLARHGYKRTRRAVWRRANRLGLSAYEAPRGYAPLSWLAPARGRAYAAARTKARTDGVLVDQGLDSPVRWIVPEEWADAYAKELQARTEAHDLEGTWWTAHDIGQALGIPVELARGRLSRPSPLRRLFEGVEFRETFHPRRRLYHPEQAARAVREYRS